jgi:RNA polymerase sigma-70 factor (ECF subfamily)
MMDSAVPVLEDEHALVSDAQASPAAFAPLYDHYFPRIYTYVRYRVADAPTADDLTSQIFERALVHVRAYRPERAPFGAWLFAIARNAVNDHLRAQRRRRWLSFEWLARHPGPEPPPEAAALRDLAHENLMRAVVHLGEKDRDLIALKFSGGLNNRQIARFTGMSEGNVAVSLYRAVQKLRRLLKDDGVDHERA